jgi:NTE family protein
VINATNVQTGSLWRFSRPYMRDYQVGGVDSPRLPLAQAVAASAAFPPVLSPVILRLDPSAYAPATLDPRLGRPPFTTRVVLSDGGVYDNLGLETAKRSRCVLVGDGGAKIDPEPRPWRTPLLHLKRTLDVVDNQVRSLRKRELIDDYRSGARTGAYWGIRTDLRDYRDAVPDLPLPLDCPHDRTLALAAIPTRLKRLDRGTQDRLINWGYAVCDAAIRAHYDRSLPPPPRFVYPGAGV